MAEALNTPSERLETLTQLVDKIERAYRLKFSQWNIEHPNNPEINNHRTSFLWAYTETIHALELIRSEKFKSDADLDLVPALESLHGRVVKLLTRATEHVENVKVQLMPVHKELLANVYRINHIPDVHNDGFSMHQISMGLLLDEIRPSNRDAWKKDGTDLLENSDFNRAYQEFCDVPQATRNTQSHYMRYARASWLTLQDAFLALDIAAYEVYPGDEFFNNEFRWTFVEYPFGSPEFKYGVGTRPGMLALKDKLGGRPTSRESARMKVCLDAEGKPTRTSESARYRELQGRYKSMKAGIRKADGETKKKDNKRSPTDEDASKPKKQRVALGGYTMNKVNAAADVEDCLRDTHITKVNQDVLDRPGPDRLLTPTVETRVATLAAYHKDLVNISNEIYKRRFGTPTNRSKLPQTAADRADWLDRAEKELRQARFEVKEIIDSLTTPAKAKRLRLLAFKIKLARALYTIGLVSGNPAASPDEINQGLIGRLDDLILHEEAWNAAEALTLERGGLRTDTYKAIDELMKARTTNIARWKELRAGMRTAGSAAIDAESVAKPISRHETPIRHSESTRTQEAVNDPEAGKDDENAKDNEAEEEGEAEVKSSVEFARVLTSEEVKNGRILLSNVLTPKKPDRGDYMLDWREERRRQLWYEEVAHNYLVGKAAPKWNHPPPVDIFADGGPPGHEKLPRKTYWDQLQYMIVMTMWRFYQLRLMEP
ncbi:hypothetical protein F4808DRAFT_436193 [Astrocystis sublimbata]|nr:hypothetical protein F4808DRAFT_436193 [Astrocystis sublimbata]